MRSKELGIWSGGSRFLFGSMFVALGGVLGEHSCLAFFRYGMIGHLERSACVL